MSIIETALSAIGKSPFLQFVVTYLLPAIPALLIYVVLDKRRQNRARLSRTLGDWTVDLGGPAATYVVLLLLAFHYVPKETRVDVKLTIEVTGSEPQIAGFAKNLNGYQILYQQEEQTIFLIQNFQQDSNAPSRFSGMASVDASLLDDIFDIVSSPKYPGSHFEKDKVKLARDMRIYLTFDKQSAFSSIHGFSQDDWIVALSTTKVARQINSRCIIRSSEQACNHYDLKQLFLFVNEGSKPLSTIIFGDHRVDDGSFLHFNAAVRKLPPEEITSGFSQIGDFNYLRANKGTTVLNDLALLTRQVKIKGNDMGTLEYTRLSASETRKYQRGAIKLVGNNSTLRVENIPGAIAKGEAVVVVVDIDLEMLPPAEAEETWGMRVSYPVRKFLLICDAGADGDVDPASVRSVSVDTGIPQWLGSDGRLVFLEDAFLNENDVIGVAWNGLTSQPGTISAR